MLSSPEFLKRCEELQRARAHPLKDGMKIARGFADLGYEEFLLLPGQKLLALYSGKITEFPEDHTHFFFPIFSADELIECIVRAGFDIVTLEYPQQRRWNGTFEKAGTADRTSVVAASLELMLVNALQKFSTDKI